MKSIFKAFTVVAFIFGTSFTTGQLRGEQYCEILWGGPLDENFQLPADANLTVNWNGLGGKCQTNPGFYNITAEDIYIVHGEKAEFVKFNGVREYLTDDSIRQRPTQIPIKSMVIAFPISTENVSMTQGR